MDSANRGSDVKLNVAFSKQPAIGEDFDVVVTVSQFYTVTTVEYYASTFV